MARKREVIELEEDTTPTANLEIQPKRCLRLLGTKEVPWSLPLANMVATVQELLDPTFEYNIMDCDDDDDDLNDTFLRRLKGPPDYLLPEDMAYLKSKGALSIPTPPLRNELLRCYIRWVHNFMPLLNLSELLGTTTYERAESNLSLLVFQAVMFAGSSFADLRLLRAAGFSSRREAQRTLFMKAKLLHSFNYEDDDAAELQAMLLMTLYNEENRAIHFDLWSWIGMCYNKAQSMGIHQDPRYSDLDPKEIGLRNRLWWCLYCRDRLLSLALRRPIQINEGISSIPTLTLDDFDIRIFAPEVREIFGCDQLGNVAQQESLAIMFIEQTKLCQCLGRVLFACYQPSQKFLGSMDNSPITLSLRNASNRETEYCRHQLNTWLKRLPKNAQFIPSRTTLNKGEDVLLVHTALLKMIYYATLNTLHRPSQVQVSRNMDANITRETATAQEQLQETADNITNIFQGLEKLKLMRFLPPSAITVLLPAAVMYMSNLTSANALVRGESSRRFKDCIRALQALSDIYPAAGSETANLEAAFRMSGANSRIMWPNATPCFEDFYETATHRSTFLMSHERTSLTPGPPALFLSDEHESNNVESTMHSDFLSAADPYGAFPPVSMSPGTVMLGREFTGWSVHPEWSLETTWSLDSAEYSYPQPLGRDRDYGNGETPTCHLSEISGLGEMSNKDKEPTYLEGAVLCDRFSHNADRSGLITGDLEKDLGL